MNCYSVILENVAVIFDIMTFLNVTRHAKLNVPLVVFAKITLTHATVFNICAVYLERCYRFNILVFYNRKLQAFEVVSNAHDWYFLSIILNRYHILQYDEPVFQVELIIFGLLLSSSCILQTLSFIISNMILDI